MNAPHVRHIQETQMVVAANAMQDMQGRAMMATIAMSAKQAHTLWQEPAPALIVPQTHTLQR
jgi:hypothetical protein